MNSITSLGRCTRVMAFGLVPVVVVVLGGCAGNPAGSAARTPPNFQSVLPLDKDQAPKSPVLGAMQEELARAMRELSAEEPRPYFIAYEVHDQAETQIEARNGALVRADERRWRSLDTDVRVGDYKFDSTHPLRGRFDFPSFQSQAASLPIEDDTAALRAVAWKQTEQRYRNAAERYVELRTRKNVEVELEDKSDDFSREKPAIYLGPTSSLEIDKAVWEKRVRALSARFRDQKHLLDSRVMFNANVHNRWLVNSEGALVQTGQPMVRLAIQARARAADGQDLRRFESFDAATPASLPSEAEMAAKVDLVINDLRALTQAPPAEPFSGPPSSRARPRRCFSTRSSVTGSRATARRTTARGRPSPRRSASRSCPASSRFTTTPPWPSSAPAI